MFSISKLKFEFPNLIRAKGLNYHQENRVSLLETTESQAVLHVRGKETYQVVVKAQKGQRVMATCTCPYFLDGNKCKHIWASYLFIEENQVFDSGQKTVEGSEAATKNNWMKSFSSFLSSEEKYRSDVQHFLDLDPDEKSEKLRSGVYTIHSQKTKLNDKVFLNLLCQEFKRDGSLGVIKNLGESEDTLPLHGDLQDQEILATLLGPTKEGDAGYYTRTKTNSVTVQPRSLRQILSQIDDAGRLYIDLARYAYSNTYENVVRYSYNRNDFEFVFELSVQDQNTYVLRALLLEKISGQRLSPQDVNFFITDIAFTEKFCFSSNFSKYANWMKIFRVEKELTLPPDQVQQFLDLFYKQPDHPELLLPDQLKIEKITVSPRLKIYFEQMGEALYEVKLQFFYNNQKMEHQKGSASFFDSQKNQIIRRDLAKEAQLRQEILQLLYPQSAAKKMNLVGKMILGASALKDVLPDLMRLEHEVYIQAAKVKKVASLDFKFTSHVDWFDLEVVKNADISSLDFPSLLQAVHEDSGFIKLKDEVILLPDEIAKKLRLISGLADSAGFDQGGKLKISKVQSLFLTSLLEQENEEALQVNRDLFFDLLEAKTKLNARESLPQNFVGELRPYQKIGVSWLGKLLQNGCGGLLADDMGLGKTVQVIAFLAKAKQMAAKSAAKSKGKAAQQVLIVCPKSLIFNWQDEFAKFSPQTKVLCYQGKNRQVLLDGIDQFDVVLTTYHSLRQDVQLLRNHEFQYFIIDEAQNIKNADAQVSMACRLVKRQHTFALTGTPVENSLQDFFSIMAVVLPGLFGYGKNINKYVNEDVELLAKAFAPFILRRKKQEVLKDLPSKSEQVLYCELGAEEKNKYDELKNYYWGQLKGVIDQQGLNKSKIQVLEALLRLRQASCHIGLLDQTKRDFVSAKFELVLEQIEEITAQGNKVLVFSQFTQLLDLFKVQLDKLNLSFHYLDGKTKDRKEIVEAFQNQDEKKIFLLSLKAGGVGLNLTAAEYVYILDPWWNPAVEAQAVDRAHRIGQTKKVFAYKMIAKDTVEEKILKLQESKKDLLEGLLSQKSSVLKNLSFDDIAEIFA